MGVERLHAGEGDDAVGRDGLAALRRRPPAHMHEARPRRSRQGAVGGVVHDDPVRRHGRRAALRIEEHRVGVRDPPGMDVVRIHVGHHRVGRHGRARAADARPPASERVADAGGLGQRAVGLQIGHELGRRLRRVSGAGIERCHDVREMLVGAHVHHAVDDAGKAVQIDTRGRLGIASGVDAGRTGDESPVAVRRIGEEQRRDRNVAGAGLHGIGATVPQDEDVAVVAADAGDIAGDDRIVRRASQYPAAIHAAAVDGGIPDDRAVAQRAAVGAAAALERDVARHHAVGHRAAVRAVAVEAAAVAGGVALQHAVDERAVARAAAIGGRVADQRAISQRAVRRAATAGGLVVHERAVGQRRGEGASAGLIRAVGHQHAVGQRAAKRACALQRLPVAQREAAEHRAPGVEFLAQRGAAHHVASVDDRLLRPFDAGDCDGLVGGGDRSVDAVRHEDRIARRRREHRRLDRPFRRGPGRAVARIVRTRRVDMPRRGGGRRRGQRESRAHRGECVSNLLHGVLPVAIGRSRGRFNPTASSASAP